MRSATVQAGMAPCLYPSPGMGGGPVMSLVIVQEMLHGLAEHPWSRRGCGGRVEVWASGAFTAGSRRWFALQTLGSRELTQAATNLPRHIRTTHREA